MEIFTREHLEHLLTEASERITEIFLDNSYLKSEYKRENSTSVKELTLLSRYNGKLLNLDLTDYNTYLKYCGYKGLMDIISELELTTPSLTYKLEERVLQYSKEVFKVLTNDKEVELKLIKNESEHFKTTCSSKESGEVLSFLEFDLNSTPRALLNLTGSHFYRKDTHPYELFGCLVLFYIYFGDVTQIKY